MILPGQVDRHSDVNDENTFMLLRISTSNDGIPNRNQVHISFLRRTHNHLLHENSSAWLKQSSSPVAFTNPLLLQWHYSHYHLVIYLIYVNSNDFIDSLNLTLTSLHAPHYYNNIITRSL